MERTTNKLLNYLLALALVFGLFTAMPLTASAANATTLFNQILAFSHGGTGTLFATMNDSDTVTVTGAVTGATNALTLDIDSGVTVIWKANYSGLCDDAITGLIELKGKGTFDVADGSVINSGNGATITASGADQTIRVSGGVVRAAGERSAIYSTVSNRIYVSGGIVQHTGTEAAANAIRSLNPGTVIMISGGTISAAASKVAIYQQGKEITVSGGTVRATGTGGIGIYVNCVNGTVNISGGTVSAENSDAVRTTRNGSNVTVSGSAEVRSDTGRAIWAEGDSSSVTVNGGAVVSPAETAIWASGAGSSVTVNGGAISSGGAVATINVRLGKYTMSGGTVKNTGMSDAVVSSDVEISNGMVSATTGAAIRATEAGAAVTMTGGFAFAYGTGIIGEGNVIHMTSGTPTIGGTSVVCAWNKPSGTPTYAEGASTDLIFIPASASAKWAINPWSQTGIAFIADPIGGFFPIDGVTVTEAAIYTVKFNSNGGSAVADQSVNSGNKAAKPANPVKAGSAFAGWYSNTALTSAYNFDNPVTANITLYAKWTDDATVNVITLQINNPNMYVNGVKQEIDPGRGTVPMIVSDRTILPIRAIVEAMGGTVGWDAATRMITLAANGHTVTMWLDKKNIIADGKNLTIEVAPVSINDRTMVPVRFAAENLGCTVDWLPATREVVITY